VYGRYSPVELALEETLEQTELGLGAIIILGDGGAVGVVVEVVVVDFFGTEVI
jgi:hypothetical protein